MKMNKKVDFDFLKSCVSVEREYPLTTTEREQFLEMIDSLRKQISLYKIISENDAKIENALITDVSLGYESHGIFTFYITIRFRGCGCNIGGYALDAYDEKSSERIASQKGLQCLAEIMSVVGVDKWEDLKGKYCRIIDCGLSGTIDTIGNIMSDDWFCISKFFKGDVE